MASIAGDYSKTPEEKLALAQAIETLTLDDFYPGDVNALDLIAMALNVQLGDEKAVKGS